ncbi:MAG: hypothetical protein ACI9VR_000930 [Cognaticolwellia sp.]|jgi:uncharacterized protein (DUF1501 family)
MRRRSFLGAVGASLLLPLGGRSYAFSNGTSSGAKHRFLFIHCTGGWDQYMVFTPRFDPGTIMRSEHESSAVAAQVNGLPFVDHANRKHVRTFLEDYGDQTAFLHGMEVRSVAHDVCKRLLLTGSSRPGAGDWGSRLSAKSDATAPMLVLSGPSYAGPHGPSVLRMGEAGQLVDLVDGSWQSKAAPITQLPSETVQALEDQFARSRAQAFQAEAYQANAPDAQAALYAQNALSAQQRVGELSALAGLEPNSARMLSQVVEQVLDLFEADQAMCAAIEYLGSGGLGFDTHAGNDLQSVHFNSLFWQLSTICQALESRHDSTGASLMESTTVVVYSEMARHPKLNFRGGREHWTYTPAMLIGGGIAGGRSVGGYNNAMQGENVDLESGDTYSGGVALDPRHLGATLMAIADQDPAQAGVPPISALLA